MKWLKRWRDARAKAAAERARVRALFESFLIQTKRLVPRAPKYPDAALYRHAWKRAVVLEILYQGQSDETRASLYREFQKLAAGRYYRVAPVGPYGKVRLRMEGAAATRLLEAETRVLSPSAPKTKRHRPLACIYIGTCEAGRVYVGQTVEAPERRWIQHRAQGSGPFKNGAQWVDWKVIEGAIPLAKLDERESYFIGFFDAFQNGYNDTRGNDWAAYERGCDSRSKA